MESTRSLLGVHKEFTRSPQGVHQESWVFTIEVEFTSSLQGVHMESRRSPLQLNHDYIILKKKCHNRIQTLTLKVDD